MSITKNHIKTVKSLEQKKYRHKLGLFVVEGVKGVYEFLEAGYELYWLFSVTELEKELAQYNPIVIETSDLNKISFLKSPNKVLAVFKIPTKTNPIARKGIKIALDGVNDPGNLGTIIRLCDWFGVADLICSITTVDCYNPKVVQATMGSLTRVNVIYTDLEAVVKQIKMPMFITDMEGSNVYKTELPEDALIIMGNEANGVSEIIKKRVKSKLTIPKFGSLQQTESLNVATATAILLSEFKRTSIQK